ncbi:MAG: CHAD domain-containing protein [Methanomicrobiales archaeon]
MTADTPDDPKSLSQNSGRRLAERTDRHSDTGHSPDTEGHPVNARCLFAAQQIIPKLDAFSKEVEGVKAAQDIEYLHRLRVASRRLRVALPLLADCYSEKKYQKWTVEIKKTAGMLGEARDLDVQIEFLKKYRKLVARRRKNVDSTPDQPENPLEGAISYLLSGVRSRRTNLQKDVISTLRNFEKQKIIEEIQSAVARRLSPPGTRRRKPSMRGITPMAADHIGREITDLISYEPWVVFPEAVAEHHAMRIAAKKLRYTLELYAPLYRLGLRKHTRRIAKLQEILGDLHDCDVWIDNVTRIILKERLQERKPGDSRRPSPITVTGFKMFQHDREKERRAVYRQFSRYWASLRQSGYFEGLKRDILTLQKSEYQPVPVTSEDEARVIVHNVATIYPGGSDHSEHVTHLALMLFEALKPLHRLDDRSRFLLECGGILHDIGWKDGKKGHPSRSADMIFSDRTLPFNLYERGVIGLIALWHRGPVQPELSGYYQLFSPDQQRTTQVLVSLLRIADGLDSTHRGLISSVSCTITPNEVVCVTIAQEDAGDEKRRALMKADLFVKIFEKTIVFQ